MKNTFTSLTGFIGVILFVLSAILGGLQFANYSHISQFISESYAIDTPYGFYLRYFGYIPSGICLTLFAISAINKFNRSKMTKIGFRGLAVFYGIGTVIVSIFPCDSGCNKELIDPSASQIIHNVASSFTYFFVPVCLILIAQGIKKDSKLLSILAYVAGSICICFVYVLSSDPLSEYAGLYQRIIEGAVLSWILACSWAISNHSK